MSDSRVSEEGDSQRDGDAVGECRSDDARADEGDGDAVGECRSDEARANDDRPDDHLEDVPDGSGCTEIWEHMSERRAEDGDDGPDDGGDEGAADGGAAGGGDDDRGDAGG